MSAVKGRDLGDWGENMEYIVEIGREDDGRWIAEIPALPGVMAYGDTEEEATNRSKALALRVLADRIEDPKTTLKLRRLSFATA
jgi:predicted RNase H-like HicB family nuclease